VSNLDEDPFVGMVRVSNRDEDPFVGGDRRE